MTNYTYHLNWKIIFSQRRLYGIWQTRKKGRKKGASSLYFCSFYASLLITLTPFALPQPASQKGPKPSNPRDWAAWSWLLHVPKQKSDTKPTKASPLSIFLKNLVLHESVFFISMVQISQLLLGKEYGPLGSNSLLIVLIYNSTT